MELSLDQIREKVCSKITPPPIPYPDVWIVDVFMDHAIIGRDGKYSKLAFEIDGDELKFGDEVEVEKEYVPVKAATITSGMRLSSASKPEADDYGYKWDVRICEFGPDRQGNIYWDPAALRAAKHLYEGAKVFALAEAQHKAANHPYGKSVRDLVGWMSDVADDDVGMKGSFNILKTAAWLRDMIVDSFERGRPDLIGLSHDVGCKATTRMVNGKRMQAPVEIGDVTIDVVYEPAAGGRFLRMAAAISAEDIKKEEEDMNEELKKLLEGLDEKIRAAVSTAMSAAGDPQKIIDEAKLTACSLILKDELKDSGLAELSQLKLKKQFEGKVFETESLRAAIKDEKEYVDKLTGSGGVTGVGHVQVTKDEMDKRVRALDDFFERKPGAHSFRACYVLITGDEKITGLKKEAARLRASLETGDWDQILGDSIARRMLKDYAAMGLDEWKKIVDVVPVSDFRTQRRMRFGGYGNLPTVLQGDSYTQLTSPADEEATYAVAKRGGTEDITLEMIKNDDVGSIRRIPQRLAYAAKRTLHEFVFNFLSGNPTIYDAVALFHGSHNNLGSTALATGPLQAGRWAMMKQAELNSSKRLGLPPKYIIVPVDLDKTAFDLISAPDTGQYAPTSPDFVRMWRMEMIVVPYWTDANDWYLVGDPANSPTIEVGFLDGNEEPELFVQDSPTVGSMFNADKLTYKIRHIYGGAVCDFRPFYGAIVA